MAQDPIRALSQRSPQVTDMARRMMSDAAQMRSMIQAAHRTRRVINGGTAGTYDSRYGRDPVDPVRSAKMRKDS